MPYRRDRCRRCKLIAEIAGPISVRGLCHSCGVERQLEAAEMMRKAEQQIVKGKKKLLEAVMHNRYRGSS